MGQKVHPVGIRLGITKEWSSRWYANSQTFPDYVEQDHRIREFLREKLKEASVSRIHIERPAKKANITIHTARPGIVIGKKGEDIEKLRAEVAKLLSMPLQDVRLNISEIRKPELDAMLVAEGIAQQLERRARTRSVKRGGNMWTGISPDKPITKKPLEVRQGKGKGNVEYWVAQVQPGKLIFEIAGVTEEVAREAFALAAAKL